MIKFKWWNKGRGIKIAVIDSGIEKNHSYFNNWNYTGISIKFNDEEMIVENTIDDKIGHGTAIAGIFKKLVPESELIFIKAFDEQFETTEDLLINSIKYVYMKYKPDIIHLSCGVTLCYNKRTLYDLCKNIVDKKTIIVASFDNWGAVSYPAAFDCVIGVDYNILSLTV